MVFRSLGRVAPYSAVSISKSALVTAEELIYPALQEEAATILGID
jgi:hypothetical protein